jgi:hypothetical protein
MCFGPFSFVPTSFFIVQSLLSSLYLLPTFLFFVSERLEKRKSLLKAAWKQNTNSFNQAFAQISSPHLSPWQAIYLLAGSLTLLFSIWCFLLPNSPATARFLTPAQRIIAVERLRTSATGVRCHAIKPAQLREAALDPKVYLVFILMSSAYTVNGAVSGFGPLIVSTFGWSSLEAILWQFPLGGICFVSILLSGYLSSRFAGLRLILLVLNCLPVIAGCAMIWKSKWSYHAAAPVAGYSIIGTFGAVVSQTISVGMSNVAGATKKSAMAAAVFAAYCVGNIVGPQLIKSQTKKDHYPELWMGLIICYCITITAAVALYVVLWRENKRRDGMEVDEEERDKLAFMDLTDGENRYFRYVL